MEQQNEKQKQLGTSSSDLAEWFTILNGLELIAVEAYLNDALLKAENPKSLLYFLHYDLLHYSPSIDTLGRRFKWKLFLGNWLDKQLSLLDSLESSSEFAETLQNSLQTGLMKEKIEQYVETTIAGKDMLSMAEVLAYLKISKPTLYKLEERAKLPRYRVGRRVLYKRSDVEKVVTG